VDFVSNWILTAIIFLPIVGAAYVWFGSGIRLHQIRSNAMIGSMLTLLLVVCAACLHGQGQGQSVDGYGLYHSSGWMADGDSRIDINYTVGIDGISVWLLLLTALLSPLAIWASFSSITRRAKEYYCLLLLLESGMLGVFCALDLLVFYVFFEFTLIPLFFLIGTWGGQERARAATKFFLFTVAGSVLTFAGVLYLAYHQYHYGNSGVFSLDIPRLVRHGQSGLIPAAVQWWIFLGLVAGFAVKVPLFPVHTWLPLAHTEAPTAGSVLLAGVLLKLGTYGFVRLALPILPEGAEAFAHFMSVMAIAGIIYGALAAWAQEDVKKLVAYSSVSHMGFCVLGMFSLKMAGMSGSVMYMLNHGLSTAALFLVVGMIYERYHTRDMNKLGGLARQMPVMATFLIIFTLSSIGLPGLNGFIGEMLVLIGTASSAETHDGLIAGPLGMAYAVPAATGIVLGAIYMLWMCRRVLFGPVNEPPGTPDTSAGLSRDLNAREVGILTPIAVLCLVIGVWPKPLLESMQPAIEDHILASRLIDGDLNIVHNDTMPNDEKQNEGLVLMVPHDLISNPTDHAATKTSGESNPSTHDSGVRNGS
jgi:NADH-quinone oxidoreductase subunit M